MAPHPPLHVIAHPGPTGSPARPLLIAHGLFGSARNWGAWARRLAMSRPVHVADMRNHGQSFWDGRHDYPALAADLAAVIAGLGAPVDLLGHSMGGKAAMQLALTAPELIRRLIIADIAPRAYHHSHAPHIEAMEGLPLTGLSTRAEADAALAPAVPDPALRAFFLQSLDFKAEGGPRWRLNLAALRAEMAAITGWPGTGGAFQGPALFLRGALSDYITPEDRPLIRALFPAARIVTLKEAGHWLHADAPGPMAEVVTAFLEREG